MLDHKNGFGLLAIVAIMIAGSHLVSADTLQNGIGLGNPRHVLTFSEIFLPSLSSLTNQYSAFGVTFSPNNFSYRSPGLLFPTADVSGVHSGAIFFSQDQNAVAFAFEARRLNNTSPVMQFTALLNGTVVQSFDASTTFSLNPDISQASNFYGFTNIQFNEVEITTVGVPIPLVLFEIDNLQFNADNNSGSTPANPLPAYPDFLTPSPDQSPPKLHVPVHPTVGGVRAQGITDPSATVASFGPSTNAGDPIYIDPQSVFGYDISVEAGGANIASFVLPVQSDPYTLHLFDGSADQQVLGGITYQFPFPGVTGFRLTGIDGLGPFDPNDPGFVYGLTFYSTADDINLTNTVVDMAAILAPEPSSLGVFFCSMTVVIARRKMKPVRVE